ncbi:MAG: ABC transporter substrate-binding protein [Betaproteobacteria bacterium]
MLGLEIALRKQGNPLVCVGSTRRLITLLAMAIGLIAAASNVAAQRPDRVAHIGILCSVRCEHSGNEALLDELRRLGWVVGSNLRIEYRGAGGAVERLSGLAQELVSFKPELIVASGPQASRALQAATSTIPIVFIAVADPVRVGLVDSLSRPGGNVTGVATVVPGGFVGKSLEVLTQALPKAQRIAVLLNPGNEVTNALFPIEAYPAARKLGVQLQVFKAQTSDEIEPAITAAALAKANALWVVGDPIFHTPVQRVPDLAAHVELPAMYLVRDLVVAGGLMSYGPDFLELHRRGAVYMDKILKGAKPADMPVEQPTRYKLVINLKTAKALGIEIAPSLLLRADEVIQ